MLFNSETFILFFAVTYTLYLMTKGRRGQNRLLLVASYVFYGWWDWRFLSLIALSTVVDFFLAKNIKASTDKDTRKKLMLTSVGVNLSILGFFKYFNFFVDSTTNLLGSFGIQPDFVTLNIVLPVGISFYTFQTLSYTIDVYREKMEPTDDFLDFALFVSFFPQLVAGPIERASALLPQISKPRHLSWGQVNAGAHLILWGLFKKVVIADRAAIHSNNVFNNIEAYSGLDLVTGALAFTLQIYGDFSGYSDIARGTAKLLGFDLMVNFKLPYFARNPSDFWRRWHVSLSSWLRDYLYISLGGNRGGTFLTYRNLCLTMLLGGLWHGAAWNFVLWGAFHGLILVIYRVTPVLKDDPAEDGLAGWLGWGWRVPVMFVFTVCGWVLFRCTTMADITWWFSHAGPGLSEQSLSMLVRVGALWVPLVAVQIWQQLRGDLLVMANSPVPLRVFIHAGLLAGIFLLGIRSGSEFLYFQF